MREKFNTRPVGAVHADEQVAHARRFRRIERLLAKAQKAQAGYWDAVRELELEAGVDFDGEDLGAMDAESVVAMAHDETEEEDE